MPLGHLDPLRAWSVGGEQSCWFKSGAPPSTEISNLTFGVDLVSRVVCSRVRPMRRPTLPRRDSAFETESMGIGLDFLAVQRSQAAS